LSNLNYGLRATSSVERAGVRWYDIHDPTGAPTIYQQGSYALDSNNRWMGSVAMNKLGYQSGVSRWGDYATLSVDPSDDCTSWFTSEYNNSGGWA